MRRGANSQAPHLERELGLLPAPAAELEGADLLPRLLDDGVVPVDVLALAWLAHHDVLRPPDCRVTEQGLGELGRQAGLLELLQSAGVVEQLLGAVVDLRTA